jgi:D-alanyl-D-alanine carboxypeptidase (penicillin-binding protein 5/6)
VLGVILGQAAGTNPTAGLAAALVVGEKMSAAVEQWLWSTTLEPEHGPAAPGLVAATGAK